MPPVQLVFASTGNQPAWLSFFLQHVGHYRSKMIMMKNLSRKYFIEAATCTAAKGKKVSSVEGNEEYMEFVFVIEPIAAPSACSFFPGAVNLAKPHLVKYLFLLSAMSRKSHCSTDTQFQPAC